MIFGAKIQTFLFWKSWILRLKYQKWDIWFSNTVKINIVEKSRQLSICIAVSKLSVFCYRVSVLVSGRKGDVIWHWFHSVKGTSKKIVRSLMISIGWLLAEGLFEPPFWRNVTGVHNYVEYSIDAKNWQDLLRRQTEKKQEEFWSFKEKTHKSRKSDHKLDFL